MIEIYTHPACGPCVGLKAQAKPLGIDHRIFDVTKDPEALARIKSLGYTGTPVTINTDTEEHWKGFDPERMESLVSVRAA